MILLDTYGNNGINLSCPSKGGRQLNNDRVLSHPLSRAGAEPKFSFFYPYSRRKFGGWVSNISDVVSRLLARRLSAHPPANLKQISGRKLIKALTKRRVA